LTDEPFIPENWVELTDPIFELIEIELTQFSKTSVNTDEAIPKVWSKIFNSAFAWSRIIFYLSKQLSFVWIKWLLFTSEPWIDCYQKFSFLAILDVKYSF